MPKKNPIDQNEAFGKRLVMLMKQKKMTVRKAAEIAGVGSSKIQSWRSGVFPSSDFSGLSQLAVVLGVSLEWLLTGANSSEPGIHDVFVDGGEVFDGYLKVKIQKIIPQHKAEKGDR